MWNVLFFSRNTSLSKEDVFPLTSQCLGTERTVGAAVLCPAHSTSLPRPYRHNERKTERSLADCRHRLKLSMGVDVCVFQVEPVSDNYFLILLVSIAWLLETQLHLEKVVAEETCLFSQFLDTFPSGYHRCIIHIKGERVQMGVYGSLVAFFIVL